MSSLKMPKTRKPSIDKVTDTVKIMEAHKVSAKLRNEAIAVIKNYVMQLDSLNRMRLRQAEFLVVKTPTGKKLLMQTQTVSEEKDPDTDYKVLCRLQVSKEPVKAHRVKAHVRWTIRSSKGPNKSKPKK
jgi:hypothetical protein